MLLQFCVKHKLKLKRSKCVLGAPAVKALGFVLNQQGKWIDPDRVLSLLKLPAAKGIMELQHLLGSFNSVTSWLSGSADLCAPLFNLLKKNAKIQWTAEQDQALRLLKEAVATAPCLRQINAKSQFTFDATPATLGAPVCCIRWSSMFRQNKKNLKPSRTQRGASRQLRGVGA